MNEGWREGGREHAWSSFTHRLPSLPPSLPPSLTAHPRNAHRRRTVPSSPDGADGHFLIGHGGVQTTGREGGTEGGEGGLEYSCRNLDSHLLSPSLPFSLGAMEPLRRPNHAASPSPEPGRNRQEGRAANDRRLGGTLLFPSLPPSLPPSSVMQPGGLPSLPPSLPPSFLPSRLRAARPKPPRSSPPPTPSSKCSPSLSPSPSLPPYLPPSRPRAARPKPPRSSPPPTPSSRF